MLERRQLFTIAAGAVLLPGAAAAQAMPPAVNRLKELGPENGALAGLAGLWDVTETEWSGPGVAPVTTTGLVAERRMIGSVLQEILRPASNTSDASVDRIDYLSFDRTEGRWKYVSMDLRVPIGIMPASSFGRDDEDRITVNFEPFAIPVPDGASGITGQLLSMSQVITRQGPERDVKDQYFILANGTGTRWLAHRYAYVRRS